MAIRNDLTVDWHLSPRLITIAAPSVEITIQDLVDTCRDLEDEMPVLSYERLISAAGKEPLGGGVSVGITATLNNAVVAFEARPGPTWELMTISGGNLVAVDENGSEIDPRYPTAFVTIDRTASSSATLADISSLQAASFGGGVAIDTTSAYYGTSFPVGTRAAPVNNTADAIAIADARGLKLFFVIGDLNLTTSDFSNGYIFQGDNPIISSITIEDGANVENCEFVNSYISGTLDNNNNIRSCIVSDIIHINGVILDSGLIGTVTLGGTDDAHILNCHTGDIATPTPPVFDFGGTGQNLIMSGYAGEFLLQNKTGPDHAVMDLNSGTITIDNTVTAGTITMRGVGQWANKDLYTGGATIVNELIDGVLVQQLDHAVFSNEVHVDQANGAAGTAFPLGTGAQPVNNLADAVTIATGQGIGNISFMGDYVFDGTEDISGYELRGQSPHTTELDFHANTATDNVAIKDADLTGTLQTASVVYGCHIDDLTVSKVAAIDLAMHDCVFHIDGLTFTAGQTGSIELYNCKSAVPGFNTPFVDLGSSALNVLLRDYTGGLEWRNINQGQDVSMDFLSGHCVLASTVTSDIIVRGVAKLTDNSSGGTTDSTNLLQSFSGVTATVDTAAIADAVWDENLSDHATPSTAGHVVSVAEAILRNKTITDPTTGIMTVYDEDGVTVLLQAQLYEGVDTGQTYQGEGAERRERLE